ncbi:putative nuclease HARBI1 [Bactrocera neohumeralis]|uniref:putative nuclease HARBI1 n=1 Tax=Bactrocera neohumeralis TaxID=98809 RepID=UPI0021652614|nr:putative nuclease HARBI1 [Bactrocera neohumeralis]
MESDWDWDFDSDPEYDDLWNVIIMRRTKEIRCRPKFFKLYDDKDFRDRFRISKNIAWNVLDCIRLQIEHKTKWNHALSPEQMLLLTLRFYATGSMLRTVGDLFGVSKSTVSRVITVVSHHIAQLKDHHIYMPKTERDLKKSQRDFFNLAKFPRVIAAIDCTHVKIISPGGEDAELFRNRKGIFSINVQTLCDSNPRIIDIVARWPGSSHDATIFRNSRIHCRLESGEFGSGIVIADSGYENNHFVITPLMHVNTSAENLFNESLIRTRNCIERSYGVWKLLRNICCNNRDIMAPPLSNEIEDVVNNMINIPNNRNAESHTINNVTRKCLIDNYFSLL